MNTTAGGLLFLAMVAALGGYLFGEGRGRELERNAAPLCGKADDVGHLIMGIAILQNNLGNAAVVMGLSADVPQGSPGWMDLMGGVSKHSSGMHAAIRAFPEPENPDLLPWWKIMVAQDSVLAAGLAEWHRNSPRDLRDRGPIYVGQDRKQTVGQLLMEVRKGLDVADDSLTRVCIDGGQRTKEDELAERYWAIGLDKQ